MANKGIWFRYGQGPVRYLDFDQYGVYEGEYGNCWVGGVNCDDEQETVIYNFASNEEAQKCLNKIWDALKNGETSVWIDEGADD